MTEGRIIKGIGGFYYVRTAGGGIYECRARGLFKKEGLTPTVGDLAEIEELRGESDERIERNFSGKASIVKIAERKNSFVRPPIANVDALIVVVSAREPKPAWKLVDAVLITAERAGASAVICVNKCDLASAEELEDIRKIYSDIYPTVFVSALTGEGTEELKELMKGRACAFTGVSGVGKSSLTNLLHGEAGMETGVISEKSRRGRNTTRHCELFHTDFGALIFDTPGFSSFELGELEESELGAFFPEMKRLSGKCRYDDCRHMREPGCAVREELERGGISATRYRSYVSLCEDIRKRKKY